MPALPSRLPLIDALKALAALLVLLNHFSSYGPLAAALREAWSGLFGWFHEYGRMAVQVFLVVAGFLAARSLSPQGEALAAAPWSLLGKRYLRLVPPYLVAIGLSVAAAAIARHWLDEAFLPAFPDLPQLLAHVLLVHSLLGIDALSAGVWYIAIDFQLFALFAMLLWAGRTRPLAPALVLAVATLSLFLFNRHPDLDNWAVYFFGSYGLGAAAWWASGRRRALWWLAVMGSVALAALLIDFRLRIGLALGVALLLGLGRCRGFLQAWPDSRLLGFLGRISYSLFLVHFAVLLLANALYARLGLNSAAAAALTLLIAGLASIGLATLFHRWIEHPAALRQLFRQRARN